MIHRAVSSGSIASLASTIVLALRGKAEIDDIWAPLNGPSQWIWGRHAKYRNGFSLRHTAVGYAIHHVASIFWATFYERFCRRGSMRAIAEAAATTSALAAFVDYRLTPQRFTPGFEKRLSKRSLVLVYAAFGLGLALATFAQQARHSPRR
jgi:hypothetical protein